jgi:hypothetical protein
MLAHHTPTLISRHARAGAAVSANKSKKQLLV